MSASADISLKVEDIVDVDVGLDNIKILALPTITIAPLELKKITAGVDPIEIKKLTAAVDPLTIKPLSIGITQIPHVQIGLDPIEVKPLTVNLGPIELNLAIKEIPSVRVHLPAHFGLGLSILGHEILSARVAGEAQVITEPYEPNACEHCEGHTKKTL